MSTILMTPSKFRSVIEGLFQLNKESDLNFSVYLEFYSNLIT